MSWQEQIIVRDSNLYEQQGLAKPLLTLIAQLTINQPDEGQAPDPDAGWCVATQDYLAMSLGCSEDQVSVLVRMFQADGWIEIKEFRDARGHKRNNYRLLRLDEIKARKTQRDEVTHKYVRVKNPKMLRNTKRQSTGRFAAPAHEKVTKGSRQGYDGVTNVLIPSESTTSLFKNSVRADSSTKQATKRQIAVRPIGKLPSSQPESSGEPIGKLPLSAGFRSNPAGSSASLHNNDGLTSLKTKSAATSKPQGTSSPASPKTKSLPVCVSCGTAAPTISRDGYCYGCGDL